MSQESQEPQDTQGQREPPPEATESPAPPDELKPWYYQYWFLYPMIIFWPLWSVLIIRSPWHNRLVAGALAWAWLIIGGYLAYVRLRMGGTIALSTVAIIAPGLIFTIVTQIHWIANRRRIMEAARSPSTVPAVNPPTAGQPNRGSPRRANRRRTRRRR